ncbi:unnamed protein product [Closterium sp. Yama58-4]|nr:unnamed protein product [Closterium sp. Yama58-4]
MLSSSGGNTGVSHNGAAPTAPPPRWQLLDVSRSLSALRSARETTVAELSRAKPHPADDRQVDQLSALRYARKTTAAEQSHAMPPADGARGTSSSSGGGGGGGSSSKGINSMVEAPAPQKLVVVRGPGIVQALGLGHHGWGRPAFHAPILQRFGLEWRPDPRGLPLLPDHGGQQLCAIVAKTDTILQTKLRYGCVTGPDGYGILFPKSVRLRTDERVLPINQEMTAVGPVRFESDG